MMQRYAVIGYVLSLLLCVCSGVGCPTTMPVASTPYGMLILTIIDETTQDQVSGAIVTASDGAYTTYLLEEGGIDYYLGVFRPGVFDLSISAPGYADVQVFGIIVSEDECMANTRATVVMARE